MLNALVSPIFPRNGLNEKKQIRKGGNMNPIEKLKAEHQNILKGIELLENGALALENGENVPPEFFRMAIDFIRNYADKYHHAKEEDILFVRLGEVGFSPEMGPVAVMLYEHDQGRAYVSGLETANEIYAGGDRAAVGDIVKNAVAYANLLRQHINKEDLILYPMAESALGEAGIQQMTPEFERVETEKSGVEAKYVGILSKMRLDNISTRA
jgi:hemerythrin-like domain-containing protein